MHIAELTAAAERCRTNGDHPGNWDVADRNLLACFSVSLLSDEPMTSEWLRDVWGIDSLSDVQVFLRGRNVTPMLMSQGQFTALAIFGLRLTPKQLNETRE